MKQDMFALRKCSPRMLNCLAGLISGYDDVRVTQSNRISDPLVIAYGPRSLLLNGGLAGILDVCLGACLLRRRSDFRELHLAGETLCEATRSQWLQWATREMLASFPRLLLLDGWYHPEKQPPAPALLWDQVPYTPVNAVGGMAGGASILGHSAIEFMGADEDLAALLQEIEKGRYPLEEISVLPGLKVATVPAQLSVSNVPGAELERLEAYLTDKAHVQDEFMNCYRRKSEGLQDSVYDRRRQYSGLRMDTNRLAMARVSRIAGLPVRLFRNKIHDYQRVFNGRQHLVLHAADLNCLEPDLLHRTHWSKPGVAMTSSIFEQLGVDFELIAFRDRLVRVHDGYVLLHIPLTIKKYDEPFDARFWNALTTVLSDSVPLLPGMPAALTSVHLQTLKRRMAAIARDYDHPYRTVALITPHGMPENTKFKNRVYSSRIAGILDELLEEMHGKYQRRRIDTEFIFIPHEIKAAARSGGRVSRLPTLPNE